MEQEKLIVRDKKQSQLQEIWRRFRRNKTALVGLAIVIFLFLVAFFAPLLAPMDPNKAFFKDKLQLPSSTYLLGTDNMGRDILSRIIFGSRISLYIGFIAVGIGGIGGTILGVFAGFYGGKLDNVIMRTMDILLAFPAIILAIAIVGVLGTSLGNLMIAVGISHMPRYARIVRSSTFAVRGQEFVDAARLVGAHDFQIIIENILPNCLAPIIVQSTLGVAQAILAVASMSFLGLGIQPPTAEWGAMLSAGRQYLRITPHLAIFPGLAIATVVLGLNLLGDGLRDALDPKLR